MKSSPWSAGVIAAILLAGVAWLDHANGPLTTFTLLYLLPIAVATYFVGRTAGIVSCVCAAGAGLAVAVHWSSSLAVEAWNAGGRLGVYLVFCILLDHLHRHARNGLIVRQVHRLLALCVGSACGLAAIGWGVQREWPATAGAMLESWGARPQDRLAKLSAQIESALRASRPVLLGSRDPMGPSCVTPAKRGDIRDKIPPFPGDLNGGPGTTMATLYTYDRRANTTAMRDFEWHQKRLKSYLENESALNQPAAVLAHELAEAARQFADEASGWSSVPDGLVRVSGSRRSDWPSYCMAALDQAIGAKDVAGAKRWSGELASACFSLDDLHQWLALVCENHLAALAFQKQCQGLFEATNKQIEKYDPTMSISAFPAGLLSLNGWGNYAEIERQAERLFTMPPDRIDEIAHDQHLTSGSIWVFPGVRACYVKLRNALSAGNQRTWDEAARAPYEHSYLINMLYRDWTADSAESMATVLRRFDAVHPHATVGELMSVLMYRGHSYAGLEWSDRFEPELLAAGNQIAPSETDEAALMAACRWTNQHYEGPQAYASTFTLRDALEQHKLDCVRATDMIGAIFRNAGRTGFGHVRWNAGTTAHSVAAHLDGSSGTLRATVVDGLSPPSAPEVWPECYFKGHAWPAGMENNPPPYAVELYLRGIDNYLWAEGYVMRGPHAGWLTTARLPYSKVLREASTRKVFEGPYPN